MEIHFEASVSDMVNSKKFAAFFDINSRIIYYVVEILRNSLIRGFTTWKLK